MGKMKLGLPPAAIAELERSEIGHAPAPGSEVRPGHVIDGRYAIIRILSQGGMSTIYAAEDLHEDARPVVLKIPMQKLGMDPKTMARFEREAEIARRLNHPSVMHFYAGPANPSRAYLVMEYLEGETLYHAMSRVPHYPEAEALKIASRICEALAYLHENGIYHRDLKPENIMLCHDGSIRLMDFGIARSDKSPRLTYVGFVPGTPHYMDPERVQCKRGDARTDIYGLGAILYEMLTGVIAFDHEDPMVIMNSRVTADPEAPRKINPSLSPQAEEIVLRAMAREPDDRYQTAAAMQTDLDGPGRVEITGRSSRLTPVTRARRFWRKARLIAPWVILPLLAQAVGFLLLWHHFAKK